MRGPRLLNKNASIAYREPLHDTFAEVFGTGVNKINGGSVLSQDTQTHTNYEDSLECDAVLVFTRHY